MLHRSQLTKCLEHLLHLLKRSVIQLKVATICFHSQSPFYVMHSLIFLLKHIERPRGLLKQTEQTSTKGISTVRVNSQLCMEIICLALRRMLVMNGSIGVWRCTGAIHISHDVIIRHCSKLLLTRMNEDWSNIGCYVLYVNNTGIFLIQQHQRNDQPEKKQ